MKGYIALAAIALAFVAIFAGAAATQSTVVLDPPSALIKVGSARTKLGILASYYISKVPRSWFDANYDCKNVHEGSLVAITSATINDNYVEDAIQKIPLGTSSLWTDGRFDDGPVKRWIWWTKKAALTSYTYRPYGVTDPPTQGETSNSCMATFRIGASYTWKSYDCGQPFYYICVIQD